MPALRARVVKRLAAWLGGAVLVAALAAGVGLFVAWAPDLPVAALEPRWAPPPSRFIEADGVRVHVRDEGPREDRAPLVLIHGTSASLHTWEGWVAALKGTRRVVTMDLPGFGLTGPAPDGDYSPARYARFVVAVMDRLGVERAVIGGNSLGGEVAWEAVLRAPPRFAGLVLIDAGGFPLAPQSIPLGFRLAGVPGVRRMLEFVLPRPLIEASLRNVYGDPARVTPELVERYFELTRREGNRRALVERFAQMRRDDPSARLAVIDVPTLILWGGRDRLIPAEAGERFARAIRGSQLVTLADLGHVPHEEDAVRTAVVVRDFLATLR